MVISSSPSIKIVSSCSSERGVLIGRLLEQDLSGTIDGFHVDVAGEVLFSLESNDIVESPVGEVEVFYLDGCGIGDATWFLELIALGYGGGDLLGSQVVINIVVEAREVLKGPLEVAVGNCTTNFYRIYRIGYK
jgi:hypothetical protein